MSEQTSKQRSKPGSGWSNVGGPVWDHVSGIRLHVGGLLRLQNGNHVSSDRWPDSVSADFSIRMAGGNRKRGLMAWAKGVR